MKLIIVSLFLMNILLNHIKLQSNVRNENKVANFVLDKETANKVAIIILKKIYGNDQIEKQLPLEITLNEKDVWIISGSIPKLRKGEGFKGGVAMIAIQKNDCKILYVTHGK